jgi:general stress protein YciG
MTTANKNPGNFSNDRNKASEAGKKGGQNSGGSNSGSSNIANDRQKASDAGKKGGQRTGGGGRA